MFLSLIKLLILFTGLLLIITAAARVLIVSTSDKYILTLQDQPEAQVALVLGAGLRRDGSPTAILRDRVQSAVELYRAGKVSKLLMSGDNSYIDYNEPGAMREYAISLGVPDGDIVLDYAGRRTYDSCFRAKHIFGVKSLITVTQSFHIPRATYICRSLGIEATGYTANNLYYRKSSRLYWNIREIPAMLVAAIEVLITHPLPILGEKEYIFPE